MKLREDRIVDGVKETKEPRRTFAKAALLGASLALFGCGDTIYNYYYTGPDGGAPADTRKTDSVKPDSQNADACIAKSGPSNCSETSYVSGVLNQGESLVFKDFLLQLDDIQVVGTDKPAAAISVLDSCRNVLWKTKLIEGEAKNLTISYFSLTVSADEIMPGYSFGAKWAKVSLKAECVDKPFWCPAVNGVINVGESLVVDSLKFRLDDIEAKGTTTSAILSVLDANDNILKKDKIAEGSSVEMTIGGKSYLISVKTVAAGITFGAKWAEIEISGKADKPCGS